MYVKYLFFIIVIGCNSKDKTFKVNPLPDKIYHYSINRSLSNEWTHENAFHKIEDTIKLNIGLQSIKNEGDSINFKLIFNSVKLLLHPVKATFINPTNNSKIVSYRSPVILDSLCNYLKGLSVFVTITTDGNVLKVNAIDDIMNKISNVTKEDFYIIKRMLSDYVSVEAIKDLLNRILSIPQNKKVKVLDSWVKNIILITKAPIKLSNIYTLSERIADSAFINIQSIASTSTDKGGNIYLQGKQDGKAILSLSSGMPYKYETLLQTTTKTNYYDVVYNEHLTLISY